MSSKPFLQSLAVTAAAAAIVLTAPAAFADEPAGEEVAIISDGGPRVDAEGTLVVDDSAPVDMPGTPPAPEPAPRDASPDWAVAPLGAGALVAGAAVVVARRRRRA